MTGITLTHGGHTNRISEALAALRAQLAARLRRYRVYRQTLTELTGLSDRELNDLGLSRSDLRQIALDSALKA